MFKNAKIILGAVRYTDGKDQNKYLLKILSDIAGENDKTKEDVSIEDFYQAIKKMRSKNLKWFRKTRISTALKTSNILNIFGNIATGINGISNPSAFLWYPVKGLLNLTKRMKFAGLVLLILPFIRELYRIKPHEKTKFKKVA